MKRLVHGSTAGQSLVEAVVVVGMVMLLATGLIAGTTSSIRASEWAKNRSLAVKYVQEGVEYARNLRNTNWTTFQATTGVWCLDKSQGFTEAVDSTCPVNIDNFFMRSIAFTWTDPRMQVVVTVSWNDGSGAHKSQVTTMFTKWR